jgi:hypothetical protein
MIANQEAASVLKEAEATERRSRQAYSYSVGAPHFFIWGVAWIAGYGGTALAGDAANWIWAGVVLLGTAARFVAGRARQGADYAFGRRLALLGVIYAFSIGLFALFWPMNGLQVAAYFPLLIAALYAGFGLWIGMRFIVMGAILAAATLGGYFFLPHHFLLWMALAGGGALILGGVWLRQA